jgi:hypothetical protein
MAYQKYKEESYNNSGGINVKISEYNTAVTEVLDLRNYTFIRPGKWTSRAGVQVSYSLPITTFTLAPRSNLQYTKDSGESYQLFDSGQTLYLRGTNAAVAGSLGTNLPIDSVVQNNYMYFANGYAFKRYDASNSVEWNSSDGAAGLLGISLFFSATFNTSLAPVNNVTAVIGTTLYAFGLGGLRNGYSLQTVAMQTKMFTLAEMQEQPYSDVATAIVGATIVAKGQWIIYGFQYAPQYGISTAIAHMVLPGASTTSGDPRSYFNDVRHSTFLSVTTGMLGGTLLNYVTFDHYTLSVDYRFQTPLNLHPKYVQTYNNMLFMANIVTSSTSLSSFTLPLNTTLAMPSTVYYSNSDDPEQVDEENFVILGNGNGDVITAMCNYQTNLLVFKQYSVHEISGSAPETLTTSDLTFEYGCVNNRAVISFENLVWFVDPTGIIEYNGSSFNDISSDKIKFYLDQVDKTNISAIHIKKNNQVVFSASNKSFVYDYVAKAWSIYDNLAIDQNAGPAYFAYGASVRDLTYWQTGASYQQSVRFNDTLNTDFGLPITLAIKTRYHKRLGESTQELWRRFFLNTTSSGTSMSAVTLNMYPDYGTSIYLQRNFTISSFQQRIDYGISAKSLSIEILIQSSQALSVNGYTVESRYLRSV